MRHSDQMTAIKAELRKSTLAARRSLPTKVRQQAALRVQDQLLDLVRATQPRIIAGYAPMPTEPGGVDLPAVLAEHSRLLLPVLRPDLDLDWAYFSGPESLSPTAPLREPTGERLGRSAIAMADLVVVPALLVDRAGVRLGRGGGSYDRALARVRPDVLVVALLYDGELVERLQAQPHDVPVTAALLPSTGVTRLPISPQPSLDGDWTGGDAMAQY